MTAILVDEVVAVAPARPLQVVRDNAPAADKTTRRADVRASGIGHDPMVDGVALLLTVPVRHMYAALLRVGLLEVRA
ncbi:hypothetical protein A5647_20940 [Mycobacterium sp. 1100029.7]|nr:hypothetical protein A5647_20940 [Mycobacterium sp. 1100029.7]